ncbi:MAG TPA: hypothetical protein VHT26_07440 [Trebonia sp.]|jgi:hypothetical protein|nr:hypothetical protein [Trebonia sp.]
MTGSPPARPAADPLGTIPMFQVNIPLTAARPAAIRHALANLDVIASQRRELDQREHQLIAAARQAGATWQQIAARLAYKDRQAAQQRHATLTRTLQKPTHRRGRVRDGTTCTMSN